jgi:hypothetical protein
MPYKCSVLGCANKQRSKSDSYIDLISYHRFPKDENRRIEWINRCGVNNDKYERICSAHFDERCFVRDLQKQLLGKPLRRMLKDDALPTKHLPYWQTSQDPTAR